MNEIAIVEQLPVITEKIKEVGEKLEERLQALKLNELVCNEETRKGLKNLRADLNKENNAFEEQRKEIKTKINEPYEVFKKTYEKEIKAKYEQADLTLKTKIDEVENGMKAKAKELAIEFFNEQIKAKTIVKEDYLTFDELNLQIGLDALTANGALVKKIKDAIIEKIENVEIDIQTLSTMQYGDEMLVEYLKHKNLSRAIKDVNDRHMVLDALKVAEEKTKEKLEQEEKITEIVDDILEAPVVEEERQFTIDDYKPRYQQKPIAEDDEIVETSLKIVGKRKVLREIIEFIKSKECMYESIK